MLQYCGQQNIIIYDDFCFLAEKKRNIPPPTGAGGLLSGLLVVFLSLVAPLVVAFEVVSVGNGWVSSSESDRISIVVLASCFTFPLDLPFRCFVGLSATLSAAC